MAITFNDNISNKSPKGLDEEQKFDFGWYIQSLLNTKNPPLESYQLEEWKLLEPKYTNL